MERNLRNTLEMQVRQNGVRREGVSKGREDFRISTKGGGRSESEQKDKKGGGEENVSSCVLRGNLTRKREFEAKTDEVSFLWGG